VPPERKKEKGPGRETTAGRPDATVAEKRDESKDGQPVHDHNQPAQVVKLTLTSGSIPQNVGYAVKAEYTIGLLQGSLGNKWKRDENHGTKFDLSELVRRSEPSAVLVIAK